jgi:hypothetical protein
MSEKPILFSAPMIRALLAGKKTMTRRLLHPQPIPTDPANIGEFLYYWQGFAGNETGLRTIAPKHCRYQPSDVLWVKEAYQIDGETPGSVLGCYLADKERFWMSLNSEELEKFHARRYPMNPTPGMFMYRSLSRIALRVADVRIERLRDITEDDAVSEGVARQLYTIPLMGEGWIYRDYLNHDNSFYTARESVKSLWQSINGRKCSWESNPWLAVISFEVVNHA